MQDKNTSQKRPAQPVSEVVDQVEQLKTFFREYGQALIIAVGLVIAAGLGAVAYRNYRENSALRASQLLMNARSSEEIQQLIQQYPRAPIIPLALMSLAARRFDEGQYEMARNTFVQLKEKFSNHPLAVISDLGRAQCLEAEGQFEQALQLFTGFAADHTNHFLTPLARFGKARCLQQLGRFAEARAEYEDFIAAYPDSEWASIAESGILFVEKDERSATKAIDTSGLSKGSSMDDLRVVSAAEHSPMTSVGSGEKAEGPPASDAEADAPAKGQEASSEVLQGDVPEPAVPEALPREETTPEH